MAFVPEYVPQTELDAVNQMLMSIGQSPLNTLSVTGIKLVNIARLVLHNTSREVQERGWNFNTDDNYLLSRDVNGKIALPATSLAVDPSDRSKRYVERVDGGVRRFYDKTNHTFVLSDDVRVDIKWFFPFETLPQAARAYIAHKAGRVFQASNVTSQVIHEFTKEREMETLAALEAAELDSKDTNAFAYDNISSKIFYR